MIQTSQQRIQNGLHADDAHPSNRKRKIKHSHSGQKKEEQSKEYCSKEQLVELVVARVNAVSKDVAFLAAKEVKERANDRELPSVYASRRDVKAVDVQGAQ